MSRLSSIIDTLSEGMLNKQLVPNSDNYIKYKDLLDCKIPSDTKLLVTGIDFNIPNQFKKFLSKKQKPDLSNTVTNVYKIDDSTLLIEFKYMTLPVCFIVGTGFDTYDIACENLWKAFSSHVDRAGYEISRFVSYGVLGITYNTPKGYGTFCLSEEEVVESFLYYFYKSKSLKQVKKCLIDSGLANYTNISSIAFKKLCFGNNSDLQLDIHCDIEDRDKTYDIVDTISTPISMYVSVKDDLLITFSLNG